MPSIDLAGRVCLLTGAATGLARAMSHGLAAAGATVIAADIDAAGLEETAALSRQQGHRGRIVTQLLNVLEPDQCRAAIDRADSDFGKLDVLVNCAGLGPVYMRHDFITRPMPFWESDPERWWTMIAVNLRGPFLLSHIAAPRMIGRGFGRIVNITTSFSTMIRGGNMPYGQTKAGLEAGTASWADDLKGTGVTANVLIPGGAADTGMIPRDIVTDRSKLVPPDAMQAPIVWLASNQSDGVTGKRFVAQHFDPANPLSDPGCAPAAWPDLAAGASRGLGEDKKS